MRPKKYIKAVRKVIGRLEPFSPAEQRLILGWSEELLRVSGGAASDPSFDDLFVTLLAYLKAMAKEAREDRAVNREEKEKALSEKLKALIDAIEQIEAQKSENKEKCPE